MYKRLHNGKIKFIWPDRNPDMVYLVGDFNKWDEHSLPMQKRQNQGFELVLEIPPGKYTFKYLIDGVWWNDPDADDYTNNFWGSEDSVIMVRNGF